LLAQTRVMSHNAVSQAAQIPVTPNQPPTPGTPGLAAAQEDSYIYDPRSLET
jgi:hypothetical protein